MQPAVVLPWLNEHEMMNRLEYCKLILEKVSFDKGIFRSELIKALHELITEEIRELKQWCIATFGLQYCITAVPEFIAAG